MIWKVLGMIGSLVMIPVILGVSAGVTLFINLITPQVEPGCSFGCPKYPAIVITIGVLLAIGMVIGWLIFASKSIFKNPKPSDQRGNTQGETGVYPKINCTNCGTAIEPEGDFCGSCGRPKSAMDHPVDITPDESPKGVSTFTKIMAILGVLILSSIVIDVIQSSLAPDEPEHPLDKALQLKDEDRPAAMSILNEILEGRDWSVIVLNNSQDIEQGELWIHALDERALLHLDNENDARIQEDSVTQKLSWELSAQDWDEAIEMCNKKDYKSEYYTCRDDAYRKRLYFALFPHLNLGNYDTMLDITNTLIESDPGHGNYRLRRGQAYAGLNNHERALEDYNKAIQIHADRENYYMSRHWSLKSLGHYKAADSDLALACKFNEINGNGDHKDFDDLCDGNEVKDAPTKSSAASDVQKSFEPTATPAPKPYGPTATPVQETNYNDLGYEAYKASDYEAAVQYFEKHLKEKPDHALACCLIFLKESYVHLGHFHKALEMQLQHISAKEDKNPEWSTSDDGLGHQTELGSIYFKLENYQKALEIWEDVLKVDPDNRGATFKIEELMYLGVLEPPKTENFSVDETVPENPYQQGISHLRNGEFQSAITKFTEFIELDPNDPTGYFKRAEAYHYGLDNCPKAISDYTQAINLGIKNPRASIQRAECY